MKQGTKNGIKRVSVDVDQMKVFGIKNNVEMMINIAVNVTN